MRIEFQLDGLTKLALTTQELIDVREALACGAGMRVATPSGARMATLHNELTCPTKIYGPDICTTRFECKPNLKNVVRGIVDAYKFPSQFTVEEVRAEAEKFLGTPVKGTTVNVYVHVLCTERPAWVRSTGGGGFQRL
jgi:hypothetical protein